MYKIPLQKLFQSFAHSLRSMFSWITSSPTAYYDIILNFNIKKIDLSVIYYFARLSLVSQLVSYNYQLHEIWAFLSISISPILSKCEKIRFCPYTENTDQIMTVFRHISRSDQLQHNIIIFGIIEAFHRKQQNDLLKSQRNIFFQESSLT